MKLAKLPSSLWRAEVAVRICELTNRLDTATALGGQLDERRKAAKAAVEESLKKAQETVEEEQTHWERLDSWWSGDTIATAWEAVHEAEVGLVRLEEAEAVKANLPWLLVWIQNAMDKGKRRYGYEEALEAQEKTDAILDLTLIERAHREVIVVNSDRYANLRAFRNNLILVTVLLGGLICVLAAWHAASPSFVTLCSAEGDKGVQCLDGLTPRRFDVALVALVGAVGGFLAIAFGLARTEVPPSRYDPGAWQVLLKPVAGAATALAGVLLIQAGLLSGPESTPSEALFLSYAAIFGFSQQLFTQFIDKRAATLINAE